MTSLADRFQAVHCPTCNRLVSVLAGEKTCVNCGDKLPVPVPMIDEPGRRPDVKEPPAEQHP